jgi:hypothetical protein
MFTVFGYLSKRDDISTRDFMDHYENRHVPLILSLAPAPDTYRRHYVSRGDALNLQDGVLGFDVITELGFADREAFLAWISAVSTGDAGERVAEDEARFLDRSRTRSAVMEDRITA